MVLIALRSVFHECLANLLKIMSLDWICQILEKPHSCHMEGIWRQIKLAPNSALLSRSAHGCRSELPRFRPPPPRRPAQATRARAPSDKSEPRASYVFPTCSSNKDAAPLIAVFIHCTRQSSAIICAMHRYPPCRSICIPIRPSGHGK